MEVHGVADDLTSYQDYDHHLFSGGLHADKSRPTTATSPADLADAARKIHVAWSFLAAIKVKIISTHAHAASRLGSPLHIRGETTGSSPVWLQNSQVGSCSVEASANPVELQPSVTGRTWRAGILCRSAVLVRPHWSDQEVPSHNMARIPDAEPTCFVSDAHRLLLI